MSLVVQWLRHSTPTGGDTGSILVKELRSWMLCSIAKEMKNKINGQAVVKTPLKKKKKSQDKPHPVLAVGELSVHKRQDRPPCFSAYARPETSFYLAQVNTSLHLYFPHPALHCQAWWWLNSDAMKVFNDLKDSKYEIMENHQIFAFTVILKFWNTRSEYLFLSRKFVLKKKKNTALNNCKPSPGISNSVTYDLSFSFLSLAKEI